jgi:hypothetical protein
MRLSGTKCRLQLEELERRDAPSTLTISPPGLVRTPPTPLTATVASQGCTNGITHAATVTSVVSCS